MGWLVALARLAVAVGTAAGAVARAVERLRAGPTQATLAAGEARRQADRAARDAADRARYAGQGKPQGARDDGEPHAPTRPPNSRPGQP